MSDKQIVLTTTGSEEEARKIARALVDRRLAACVNIVPQIESIYRWQEKIDESREWLLLIKTSTDLFPAVRDAIRELHSYDLPECIAVNIENAVQNIFNGWLTRLDLMNRPFLESAAVRGHSAYDLHLARNRKPSSASLFPGALNRT
jgi:periplasmic divalent cation tolerance protein